MELDRTSMFVRVFLFCDELCSRFAGNVRYVPPERTDLCQYVRVVFVWAPLIVAAFAIAAGGLAFTVVYMPVRLFGWGYGWFWLILLGVAAAILLVAAAVYLMKMVPAVVRGLPRPVRDAGALVAIGYRGFKDRFCPLIRFGEEG